jgi:hypothetical protein
MTPQNAARNGLWSSEIDENGNLVYPDPRGTLTTDDILGARTLYSPRAYTAKYIVNGAARTVTIENTSVSGSDHTIKTITLVDVGPTAAADMIVPAGWVATQNGNDVLLTGGTLTAAQNLVIQYTGDTPASFDSGWDEPNWDRKINGRAADTDDDLVLSVGVTAYTFDDLFPGVDPDAEILFTSSGSVVPIPPAVWLFGSGLLGLVGIARRRKVA